VWEGGVRVPLIVSGPGIPAGHYSSVRGLQVDLYPTIARLAGVSGDLPDEIEGGDLEDALLETGDQVDRPYDSFVVHYPHYDKDPEGPASSILLGNRKLVRYYEDGSLHLYDVGVDYEEKDDLAPDFPDEAKSLESQMDAYLQAVDAQMPGHL
jgi:arylsulfatase A-like enzyme